MAIKPGIIPSGRIHQLASIGALIEELGFAADSPLEEAVSSELVSEAKIPC